MTGWQNQPEEAAMPIPVIIQAPLPPGFHRVETPSQISSYGFTLSKVVGDLSAMQLIGEDPLRIALFVIPSAIVYIGSKKEMMGAPLIPATGSNGPGMRLPAVTNAFPIRGTDEVWIGFTAAVEVGVWVERRVPGGVR